MKQHEDAAAMAKQLAEIAREAMRQGADPSTAARLATGQQKADTTGLDIPSQSHADYVAQLKLENLYDKERWRMSKDGTLPPLKTKWQ